MSAPPSCLDAWTHWLHAAHYDPACGPPAGSPPWEALASVGFQEPFGGLAQLVGIAPPAVTLRARRTLALNLVRAAAFRRIAAALDQAGVAWMALKGAAIVARFPDRLGQRRMIDYDLLVSPAQRALAQSVLAAQGLNRARVAGPATSWWIAEESWLLVEGTLGIELDVHRGFHNFPLFPGMAPAYLARRQRVGGAWVPDVADHLVHIALHRVRSATPPGHRELWDVCLLIASADAHTIDLAWERANARGLAVALLALFAQVTRAFGCPPARRGDHKSACPLSGWTHGPAASATLPPHATRWLDGRTPRWAAPLVSRQPVLRKYVPLISLSEEGPRVGVALGIHAALAGADRLHESLSRWTGHSHLRRASNSTTPTERTHQP